MDHEYLTDLQLFKPPTPIKVKILRIWKSTTPNNPKNLLSLDFLIADVKKNVMQAMIRGFDAPLFIPMLKEGAVYLIDKYRIMKSKHNFNVLPEDLMIVLSRMSKVKEIVEDNTQYPDYYFNFVHFKDLPDKIYIKKILTDVIGIVTTITPITKVQLNNRDVPVQKRDIYIQNASCESLKVVLYGDIALSIQEQEILQRNTNVVLAFVGLMIKTYMRSLYASSCSATRIYIDPEISEVHELKQRYQKQPIQADLQLLETCTQFHSTQQSTVSDIHVADLLAIEPKKTLNTKFQLTANIIDVQAPNGWYYNACNQCAVGLRFCAGKFWCPIHDEKTPVLTMILELIVEDLTGKIQLLAFGQQAEKLIGVTIGELVAIKTIDKMVLPLPVKTLINARKTFKVGLTGKAIEAGLTIFKIFDFANLTDSSTATSKMYKGTTSVNEQPICSQPSLLTIQDSQLEMSPSPTNVQVAKELFPEESLGKKMKIE